MADVSDEDNVNAPGTRTGSSSMLLALGDAQLTLDCPPLNEPFQGYETEQRQFVIPDNNDLSIKTEIDPSIRTVDDGSNEKIDTVKSESCPSQSSNQANGDIIQQNDGETVLKSEKQEVVSPAKLMKNAAKRKKKKSSPSKNGKEIAKEPKVGFLVTDIKMFV